MTLTPDQRAQLSAAYERAHDALKDATCSRDVIAIWREFKAVCVELGWQRDRLSRYLNLADWAREQLRLSRCRS